MAAILGFILLLFLFVAPGKFLLFHLGDIGRVVFLIAAIGVEMGDVAVHALSGKGGVLRVGHLLDGELSLEHIGLEGGHLAARHLLLIGIGGCR